ncbi:MAG: DUF2630 family protein [Pseudonocardia sp.]|nr:DUF2630 family protein [Pseudonocardia sp.]
MDDTQIAAEINRLVETEHRLERAHLGAGLSEAQAQQVRSLEVQLDQCWDLLRQRRARRAAGLDPDEARARDADVVEHYRQ